MEVVKGGGPITEGVKQLVRMGTRKKWLSVKKKVRRK